MVIKILSSHLSNFPKGRQLKREISKRSSKGRKNRLALRGLKGLDPQDKRAQSNVDHLQPKSYSYDYLGVSLIAKENLFTLDSTIFNALSQNFGFVISSPKCLLATSSAVILPVSRRRFV